AAAPAEGPAEAPGRTGPAPTEAPLKAQPPAGEREELVRISAMLNSIAEHMTRSLATSPHAWTLHEVDVTTLVQYRESEKQGFQQRNGVPLTYLPFVAQALCETLKEYPYLNSTWTDDGIVLKHYINLGLAVSVPEGLIVPVVKDADQLGFVDLTRAIT